MNEEQLEAMARDVLDANRYMTRGTSGSDADVTSPGGRT